MSEKFQDVKIYPVKKSVGSIRANGSVLINGIVRVNFAIRQGSNGLFASLPGHMSNQADENGKKKWYSDVSLPDEQVRLEFQKVVISAYNSTVGNSGQAASGEESQVVETDTVPF